MAEIDQGDLASYSEVCQLLRNAERREREGKRRLRLVQVACIQSFTRSLSAEETRQAVLEATLGRKTIPAGRKGARHAR